MGTHSIKEFPEEEPVGLVFHVKLRVQTGVHENVKGVLIEPLSSFQECPMRFGNCRGPILSEFGPIGNQRLEPAVAVPKVCLQWISARIEYHDFMISPQENRGARPLQFQ